MVTCKAGELNCLKLSISRAGDKRASCTFCAHQQGVSQSLCEQWKACGGDSQRLDEMALTVTVVWDSAVEDFRLKPRMTLNRGLTILLVVSFSRQRVIKQL